MTINRMGLSLAVAMAASLNCAGAYAEPGEKPMSEPIDPSTLTREERIEMRSKLQPKKTMELAPQAEQAAATEVTGEVPDELLDSIMADLEGRTGAARSEFSLKQAKAVVWNDGSLGCPEPGQMYTQALIEGYHVIIDFEGEHNDYRAAANGYFKLCKGLVPSL